MMNPCRLFLSQEALDSWLAEGRAEIKGDQLKDLREGRTFNLREGVRFLSEVSGLDDAHKLVGKVKDLAQLAELKGEHLSDSVVLGDNAYQVQPGFVGTPEEVVPVAAEEAPATGEGTDRKNTIAALQAFFLTSVK